MKKDLESAILNVGQSMNNAFLDEEDRGPVDKIEIGTDGNMMFTAELLAMAVQYSRLTGNRCDLLEFIGILNKLAFQYMRDSAEDSAEKK